MKKIKLLFVLFLLLGSFFLIGCTGYNGPGASCSTDSDCSIGLVCSDGSCSPSIGEGNEAANGSGSNVSIPELIDVDLIVSVPYWTQGDVYLGVGDNATVLKLNKIDKVIYEGKAKLDMNKKFYFSRGSLNTKSVESFDLSSLPRGLYAVSDWIDSNKVIDKPGFQKGVVFGGMLWRQEDLNTPNIIDYNLDLAKSYGVEWISLVNTWYTFPNSSDMQEIKPFYATDGDYPDTDGWSTPTLTDEQLEEIIQKAHARGMKVFLKPGITNFGYGPSNHEGGDVAPSTGWDHWFEEYTKFAVHFADLAEKNHVEMYAIGTELDTSAIEELANMGAPSDATDRWRKVISEVRKHYSGKITFSISCQLNNPTNWNEFPCHAPKNIKFWDDLDYIGFEPYFPLTLDKDPSIDELVKSFSEKLDSAEYTCAKQLYEKYGKPVVFTELSFHSWNGSNIYQLNSPQNPELDLYEQSEQYEAMFEAIENKSWIVGTYPWAWYLIQPSDDMKWQLRDSDGPFTGKPAGQVIKKWYLKIRN